MRDRDPLLESAVPFVRGVKRFLGLLSGTTVAGVPLDWPARFVGMAVLYAVLIRWISPKRAALGCFIVLTGSEILEIIAVLPPHPWYWPDLGDAADLACGLAGIAGALLLHRRWLRSRDAVHA